MDWRISETDRPSPAGMMMWMEGEEISFVMERPDLSWNKIKKYVRAAAAA